MIYRIDGREIGSVYPPEGGFWQLGGFQGDNPWRNGGRMAPFDQPVNIITFLISLIKRKKKSL